MKEPKRAAVVYLRVSTREQGTSGLGLEAQRHSVDVFCEGHGYQVVGEHQDVESGKNNARPGLMAALATAKAAGATLIIAKLDRLSRNTSFIMALRDSGVDFIAADMPDANTTTVGIMAVLAQAERELISTRTRAALAALKARGVKLGSPTNNLDDAARQKASAKMRELAMDYHKGAITHAVSYRAAGWTFQRIADQLNAAGAKTRYEKAFTPTTVRRLLRMAESGV
jgi:DNA invertase Pin-like site-specific DNA recombinase